MGGEARSIALKSRTKVHSAGAPEQLPNKLRWNVGGAECADYKSIKPITEDIEFEMERRDLCWKVSLKPTRSELPVLPHSSFGTITQSKREAIKMAERRVDQFLTEEATVLGSANRF